MRRLIGSYQWENMHCNVQTFLLNNTLLPHDIGELKDFIFSGYSEI